MKFFEPKDFAHFSTEILTASDAAELANAKLEKEGMRVYSTNTIPCDEDWYPWCENKTKEDTHQALLICIEPINKCKHPKDRVKMKDSIKNGEEWYHCECGSEVRPKEFEEIK